MRQLSQRTLAGKPFLRRARLALAAITVCLLCFSSVQAEPPFRDAAGGMKIKDLQAGKGAGATEGQVATIHFIGWIDDGGTRGRELYNTHREGQPVSFVIGTSGVMQGWNEGVLGMQAGGKRLLLVPPGMAYGNRAIDGVVPANASLMFRIELVDLRDP
jgi:FKBP-type peptidyl-prolyl cis-trans isomerase FkpA